jgi:hypothetical protein
MKDCLHTGTGTGTGTSTSTGTGEQDTARPLAIL